MKQWLIYHLLVAIYVVLVVLLSFSIQDVYMVSDVDVPGYLIVKDAINAKYTVVVIKMVTRLPVKKEQTSMPNYPAFMDGLMNTAPGSIERRYPKYWNDGEGGIDWIAGANNSIVSLTDGEIVGAGYFCIATGNFFMSSPNNCSDNAKGGGYGVVTVRVVNDDGSKTDLYYQHILIAANIKLTNHGSRKQLVKKGQIIGHANPRGNIEMGVNVGSSWGGIWGPSPSPGNHVDPEKYLRNLANSFGSNTKIFGPDNFTSQSNDGSVVSTIVSSAKQAHDILNNVPGFLGIIEAIDKIEQFTPYQVSSSNKNVQVSTSNDPCWKGVKDGTDWTQVPACQPWNLQCFDPGQCTSYLTGGSKVSAVGPAMSQTGPTGIIQNSQIIQGIIQFIMDNTIAFTFRAFVVILGIIILIGLIMNALQTVSEVSTGNSIQENVASVAKKALLA